MPSAAPAARLEVEAISGLGLFADERAQSQALLAAALSARDAGVVPPEVTAKAWALAAEGRNPLTGAACGSPLGPWQARKRWGPALGIGGSVNGHVWCHDDGGCELNVHGGPIEGPAGPRFHLEAPITREGAALTALGPALSQLVPPAPDDTLGVGGLLGSMGGAQPLQDDDKLDVSVSVADQRGRGAQDQRRHDAFPALTVEQVLACLPPGGSRLSLLIEVSASGPLSRCEGEPGAESTAARCACGQLQKTTGAPWLSGRRWDVNLDVDRRDQTSADRRLVITGSWNTYIERVQTAGEKYPHFKTRVEDPSIEAWTPGASRLATGCFAQRLHRRGADQLALGGVVRRGGPAHQGDRAEGFPAAAQGPGGVRDPRAQDRAEPVPEPAGAVGDGGPPRERERSKRAAAHAQGPAQQVNCT